MAGRLVVALGGVVAGALALTACAIPVQSATSSSAPTAVVTTPSASPTTVASDTATMSTQSPTSGTIIVATDPTPTVSGPAVGVVTLSQFFRPDDSWRESEYSVADRQKVQGIAHPVNCLNRRASLELRLSNAFQELDFEVAQENYSNSSSETLVVDITANGARREARKIPFNKIEAFQVNVVGVNALIVNFSAENGAGGGCETIAVFLNGRLK